RSRRSPSSARPSSAIPSRRSSPASPRVSGVRGRRARSCGDTGARSAPGSRRGSPPAGGEGSSAPPAVPDAVPAVAQRAVGRIRSDPWRPDRTGRAAGVPLALVSVPATAPPLRRELVLWMVSCRRIALLAGLGTLVLQETIVPGELELGVIARAVRAIACRTRRAADV